MYNAPEAFPCKHSDIIYYVLLVSLLHVNVGVSFSLCCGEENNTIVMFFFLNYYY